MATVQRVRRRILTYLITLLGGVGFVLGITEKDALAIGASPQEKPGVQGDSRTAVTQSNRDSQMKFREPAGLSADTAVRQEIVVQQQDILVKMEELRQMMNALQEKLDTLPK